MATKTISIEDLGEGVADFVRGAERGEVFLITRDGEPMAALVLAAGYERLRSLRTVGSAEGLASIAGGWDGSDELVRILDESPRIGSR